MEANFHTVLLKGYLKILCLNIILTPVPKVVSQVVALIVPLSTGTVGCHLSHGSQGMVAPTNLL